MKIFNLHSNTKKEVKNLKKVSHEEYDQLGKLKSNQYVEFTVIGKNRSWIDFMPLKVFKKLNPNVILK